MRNFIFMLWAIMTIVGVITVYDKSKNIKDTSRKYTIECLGGVSYYKLRCSLTPAYIIKDNDFFVIPCEEVK